MHRSPNKPVHAELVEALSFFYSDAMPFWTYMLHCRGGYFYVGHTDELERRIAQHQHGAIPGFTADHQPVELVWSQEFPTRDEAKASEKQIKGWSRAKKLALIREDWGLISNLAKGKTSPSTSSGKTVGEDRPFKKTVRPELVEGQPFPLICHPAHPPLAVSGIAARVIAIADGWLRLRWRIEGSGRLVVPGFAGKGRAENLWTTTCFEAFLKPQGGQAYTELNLSPSERWAAYDFSATRVGMAQRPFPREPACTMRLGSSFAIFDAAVPLGGLPALPCALGLSAVIEEEGGAISYWALAHPPGDPDFHHPACFAATLGAPSGA